ncbi:MAG: peptide chain release factor N(5)-glutamine methyltransferase, partial [Akkermansia sp.]|nr:peptide chain release factor N(5)-glutamine methyltransferase [Akkermansia sp.]
MMKTIQDVLQSGTEYLESRGVEGARHSMQSLLVHVLGCNKTWLYLHYDDPLPEDKLAPLRELLRRRG